GKAGADRRTATRRSLPLWLARVHRPRREHRLASRRVPRGRLARLPRLGRVSAPPLPGDLPQPATRRAPVKVAGRLVSCPCAPDGGPNSVAPMGANGDLMRRFWEAGDRVGQGADPAEWTAFLTDDVVWEAMDDAPDAGTYRGKEGLTAY